MLFMLFLCRIVPPVTSTAAISGAKVGYAQPVVRPVPSTATYATVKPKNNATSSVSTIAINATTATTTTTTMTAGSTIVTPVAASCNSNNSNSSSTTSTVAQTHTESGKVKNAVLGSANNGNSGPVNNNSSSGSGPDATAASSANSSATAISSTGNSSGGTPKKVIPARGAPPPIPPNKPVLAPSALKEKSKEIQARAKLKGAVPGTGSQGEKNTANSSPSNANSSRTSPAKSKAIVNQRKKFTSNTPQNAKAATVKSNSATTTTKTTPPTTTQADCDTESLCPEFRDEIADFQKMLVSMENN